MFKRMRIEGEMGHGGEKNKWGLWDVADGVAQL